MTSRDCPLAVCEHGALSLWKTFFFVDVFSWFLCSIATIIHFIYCSSLVRKDSLGLWPKSKFFALTDCKNETTGWIWCTRWCLLKTNLCRKYELIPPLNSVRTYWRTLVWLQTFGGFSDLNLIECYTKNLQEFSKSTRLSSLFKQSNPKYCESRKPFAIKILRILKNVQIWIWILQQIKEATFICPTIYRWLTDSFLLYIVQFTWGF